jgi:Arc/MetJ family transcription regulator
LAAAFAGGAWQSQGGNGSALKSASSDAIFDAIWRFLMRTTITIDDDLIEKATKYTGIKERSALIAEALRQLVVREAGKRLAALGGTEPDFVAPPRRRFPAE